MDMTTDMRKDLQQLIYKGWHDQAKKTLLKKLRLEYMDEYEYQRFMEWWSQQGSKAPNSGGSLASELASPVLA